MRAVCEKDLVVSPNDIHHNQQHFPAHFNMAHLFRRDGNVLYCEQCGDTEKIDIERPCPFAVTTSTTLESSRPAKQPRYDKQEEQQTIEKENHQNLASSSSSIIHGQSTTRRTRTSAANSVTSNSVDLLAAADHTEQQARTTARTARRIGNNPINQAKDFDGGIYKGNDDPHRASDLWIFV